MLPEPEDPSTATRRWQDARRGIRLDPASPNPWLILSAYHPSILGCDAPHCPKSPLYAFVVRISPTTRFKPSVYFIQSVVAPECFTISDDER